MQKITNNLKLARNIRGLSQYELARRTEISQARISLLENGYSAPKPVELKAMAMVLGVLDPSELWCATPFEG